MMKSEQTGLRRYARRRVQFHAIVSCCAVVGTLVGFGSKASFGAIRAWDGNYPYTANSNRWSDANNWIGDVKPGQYDSAVVDDRVYEVSLGQVLNEDFVVQRVTFDAAALTSLASRNGTNRLTLRGDGSNPLFTLGSNFDQEKGS